MPRVTFSPASGGRQNANRLSTFSEMHGRIMLSVSNVYLLNVNQGLPAYLFIYLTIQYRVETERALQYKEDDAGRNYVEHVVENATSHCDIDSDVRE